MAGGPEGRPLPWERQASQSCQVRPEEAREPTSGTAKGSTLSMLCYVHWMLVPGSTMLKMSGSTWRVQRQRSQGLGGASEGR